MSGGASDLCHGRRRLSQVPNWTFVLRNALESGLSETIFCRVCVGFRDSALWRSTSDLEAVSERSYARTLDDQLLDGAEGGAALEELLAQKADPNARNVLQEPALLLAVRAANGRGLERMAPVKALLEWRAAAPLGFC